jgi:hypothetical protein
MGFEVTIVHACCGAHCGPQAAEGEAGMLWTILVVLLILFLLGVVGSYIVAGFVLFVVALGAVLIRSSKATHQLTKQG